MDNGDQANAERGTRSAELVTVADHDAGFKDFEVTYRSGAREVVRFHAPSRRALKAMIFEGAKGADLDALLVERSSGKEPGWIDRLDFACATEVERIVAFLAFGTDTQKKMGEAILKRVAEMPTSSNGAPSPPSASASPAASPPEKCADGVCRS